MKCYSLTKRKPFFFDDAQDLLAKAKYYLVNGDLRKRIARRGYERTRTSDYSYDNMVRKILYDIKTS